MSNVHRHSFKDNGFIHMILKSAPQLNFFFMKYSFTSMGGDGNAVLRFAFARTANFPFQYEALSFLLPCFVLKERETLVNWDFLSCPHNDN